MVEDYVKGEEDKDGGGEYGNCESLRAGSADEVPAMQAWWPRFEA